MDLKKLLTGIDRLLTTQNLRPEQQERFYILRGGLEAEIERRQKEATFNAVRRAFQRALEHQTQSPFLGERLTGGIRNIPGTEGGGVEILPQQTPSAWIRQFIPNPYQTQDRMILTRPRWKEQKGRVGGV